MCRDRLHMQYLVRAWASRVLVLDQQVGASDHLVRLYLIYAKTNYQEKSPRGETLSHGELKKEL